MRFLLVIKLNLFKPSYPTRSERWSAVRAGVRTGTGAGAGADQARQLCVCLGFGYVGFRQQCCGAATTGLFNGLQVAPGALLCPLSFFMAAPSTAPHPCHSPSTLLLQFCIAFKVTVLLP